MIDSSIFIVTIPQWTLYEAWSIDEAFFRRISLCLLNEKNVNWRTWQTLYLEHYSQKTL